MKECEARSSLCAVIALTAAVCSCWVSFSAYATEPANQTSSTKQKSDSQTPKVTAYAPPPEQAASLFSEVRFGFAAQDPGSQENGSPALSGEVLLQKPLTSSDVFASYFIPRPHVGGSVNLAGKTNYAYAGLTWTFDLTPQVFVEGSLGGAIHDGYKGALAYAPDDRAALGCSPVFRQAGSIGYRLSDNWSVIASVENLSSSGACSPNQSLTNFGARLGYSF